MSSADAAIPCSPLGGAARLGRAEGAPSPTPPQPPQGPALQDSGPSLSESDAGHLIALIDSPPQSLAAAAKARGLSHVHALELLASPAAERYLAGIARVAAVRRDHRADAVREKLTGVLCEIALDKASNPVERRRAASSGLRALDPARSTSTLLKNLDRTRMEFNSPAAGGGVGHRQATGGGGRVPGATPIVPPTTRPTTASAASTSSTPPRGRCALPDAEVEESPHRPEQCASPDAESERWASPDAEAERRGPQSRSSSIGDPGSGSEASGTTTPSSPPPGEGAPNRDSSRLGTQVPEQPRPAASARPEGASSTSCSTPPHAPQAPAAADIPTFHSPLSTFSPPSSPPTPAATPQPHHVPETAVRVQLDALRSNDSPEPGSGIGTVYAFSAADDTGQPVPWPKFAADFQKRLASALVNHAGATTTPVSRSPSTPPMPANLPYADRAKYRATLETAVIRADLVPRPCHDPSPGSDGDGRGNGDGRGSSPVSVLFHLARHQPPMSQPFWLTRSIELLDSS